jgi:hypothetical protein
MAVAPTVPPNLNLAVQYARLAKAAEEVPPNQTVYNPGDIINVTYDAINVNYTVVTTFYGNDLATDANPARAQQIVSFGFVAQDSSGNAVVSIRGTEGLLEWLQDARYLLVKCPFLKGAGNTEDGFTAVYQSLRLTTDPKSTRLIEALPNMAFPHPVSSLTICGHSLGGALVTLFALDVAANIRFTHPAVYSYASPRTGDSSFVDTYNQLVPNTLRFANRLDIVPKVPLRPPYQHVLGLFDLNPKLDVKFDLLCQHHLTTYMFLISRLGGGTVLPVDEDCKPKTGVV